LDQIAEQLRRADGVMIGRAAYENPYLLAEVDRRFFHATRPPPGRRQLIWDLLPYVDRESRDLLPYVDRESRAGTPLHCITRHLLGLFQGVPGARAWRRYLSEHVHRPGAGSEVLAAALHQIPEPVAP